MQQEVKHQFECMWMFCIDSSGANKSRCCLHNSLGMCYCISGVVLAGAGQNGHSAREIKITLLLETAEGSFITLNHI